MPTRMLRYIVGVAIFVISYGLAAVMIRDSEEAPSFIKALAGTIAAILFVLGSLSIGKMIGCWQISQNPAAHKKVLDLELPIVVPNNKPIAPKRLKDFHRWQIIWRKCRGWVDQGMLTHDVRVELKRIHFNQPPTEETLDKIIAAGLAGELNDPPKSS